MCREFDEALECRRRRRPGRRSRCRHAGDGDDLRRVPDGLDRVQAFLEAVSLVTDLDDIEGEQSAPSR